MPLYNTLIQQCSTKLFSNTSLQHTYPTLPQSSSPTLFSNTSLQQPSPTHLSNSLLQHFSPILFPNTSLQQFSTTLIYRTSLQHSSPAVPYNYVISGDKLNPSTSISLLKKSIFALIYGIYVYIGCILFPPSLFPPSAGLRSGREVGTPEGTP